MDNNFIHDSVNVERGSDTAKNSGKAPKKKASISKGVSLIGMSLEIFFGFHYIFLFSASILYIHIRLFLLQPEIANFRSRYFPFFGWTYSKIKHRKPETAGNVLGVYGDCQRRVLSGLPWDFEK